MNDLRWDLSEIYSNYDDIEIKKDIDKVNSLLKDINNIKDQTKNKDIEYIESLIEKYEKQIELFSTLISYSYALLTVETNNENYVKLVNDVNSLNTTVSKSSLILSSEFAALEDVIKPYLDNRLKDYKFIIKEFIEDTKHQMSFEEEELASEIENATTSAFSRLQEAICSNSTKEIDGKKLTVSQLRALGTHKDREIRQKAYEKELEIFEENKLAFATSLNSIKGTKIVLDKKRNYKSPLHCSLRQSRISEKVLNALVSAIEDHLVDFRRYLKIKAKLLNIDKLGFFDLCAPLSSNSKTYTYDQAKEFILTQFGAFHTPLRDFAKNCFDKRYLDVEPRANKAGGAYCTSFPKIKQIRILSNFDSSYQSVSTVAHELGHGYHDFVCKDNKMLLKEYPMTIAETASIFSEYLVFKGALDQEKTKEGKVALIESFLCECSQTCVDVLGRFYFEKAVYENRKYGELSADKFSSLMLDAQKRTYGDGLDEKYMHKYMWAVKGHYYMPSLSFYNYPYFFGQLFSLGLASIYEKEGKSFALKYDKLLKISASDSLENIAKTVGIDITDKKFWLNSLKLIIKYVDKMEELVK